MIRRPCLLETRAAWAKEVRKSSSNGLAHLRYLVSSVSHKSQGLEDIKVRSFKAQEAKKTYWASEVTRSTRSRSQKQQNNCLWLPGSTVKWTSFQPLFLMIKRCWKKHNTVQWDSLWFTYECRLGWILEVTLRGGRNSFPWCDHRLYGSARRRLSGIFTHTGMEVSVVQLPLSHPRSCKPLQQI